MQANPQAYVTHGELAVVVSRLATKDDLAAAIEPLATKAELAAAIAPLATKADLQATREEFSKELKDAVSEMKHFFGLAVEQFKDEVKVLHDAYIAVSDRQRRFELETNVRFERIERRLDAC